MASRGKRMVECAGAIGNSMRRLPKWIVARIRNRVGVWSDHAWDNAFLLGSDWPDVETVAETANWWQAEKDELRPGEYKYKMTGRDTHGRPTYTVGKEIVRNGVKVWYVVTFHEDSSK